MSFLGNARDWPEKPLIEVAPLKRGYDLPVSKRNPGTVPIYAANGENGSHDEVKIEGPGVVTGRSGTIGKVHYVEGGYWPLNTALYVTDFKGNDQIPPDKTDGKKCDQSHEQGFLAKHGDISGNLHVRLNPLQLFTQFPVLGTGLAVTVIGKNGHAGTARLLSEK